MKRNPCDNSVRVRWAACLLVGTIGLPLSAAADPAKEAADEAPKATESIPDGRRVTAIEVFPSAVEIADRYRYRQILVTGVLDSGERVDLTRLAELTDANGLVSVSAQGIVRPRKGGEGAIAISFGDHRASVPVKVGAIDRPSEVNYIQDVAPTMSRIGCNQGTCHGAAKGKNGFKLSLRGYDPVFDHRALTDDLQGRRFNKAAPDRSLFLLKVSGAVPHVGGVHTQPGEAYYEILRQWVADGAPLDLDVARVEKIDVFPKSPIIPLPNMRQQVAVLATYTDGKVRDVTAESFVEASNTEIITVDDYGTVTGLRRGESAVLVRYEGRYASLPIVVMGDRTGYEWKDVPAYSYVDELVYEKLRAIKALPSEVCTDAEFLRRVSIDLTGLPPSTKAIRTFLLDSRDSRVKRAEVVDRLIGSPEFIEFWTNKWADLLQVNRKFLGPNGASALRDWIRRAVASNTSYQDFVYTILTGSGSTLKNPPAAYFKILRNAEDAMENTTQLFLGVRFNCNKCHDHPFERWTQHNYWELASFFAQIGRKDAPGSRKMPRRSATQTQIPAFEEIIFDKEEGEVSAPDGSKITAAFPYSHQASIPEKSSRREQLAKWLTADANPYFARSFVNRVWSYFFGVGFIDPVDDIRAGNPATNPELLDRLTAEFVESGFDVRRLMRRILHSRTYQHSIRTNRWNADDDINFSHALARRLPAEVLFDAIHIATGSRPELPGTRPGTLATELVDASVKLPDGFLDLFGRPPRESACECERTGGLSLGHSLNLVNGPTVANAINDPENSIAEYLAIEKRAPRIIEELFLSFLSRYPTKEETDALSRELDPNDVRNLAALSPEVLAAVTAQQEAFEKAQVIPEWTTLKPELVRSSAGSTLKVLDDGTVIAEGDVPDTDTYTVVATTNLKDLTGVRLEVLPDETLGGGKGPGRADNGNFVLTEFRVAAVPLAGTTNAAQAVLQNVSQTFTQKDFAAAQASDGKIDKKGWAIGNEFGKRHRAVFEFKENVGADGGSLLTFTLDHQFGSKHSIGKFRLSVTTTPRPVRVLGIPEDIASAIRTPKDKRSDEEKAKVYRFFVSKNRDVADKVRLHSAQDIAWALVNSPAFLFNR